MKCSVHMGGLMSSNCSSFVLVFLLHCFLGFSEKWLNYYLVRSSMEYYREGKDSGSSGYLK